MAPGFEICRLTNRAGVLKLTALIRLAGPVSATDPPLVVNTLRVRAMDYGKRRRLQAEVAPLLDPPGDDLGGIVKGPPGRKIEGEKLQKNSSPKGHPNVAQGNALGVAHGNRPGCPGVNPRAVPEEGTTRGCRKL